MKGLIVVGAIVIFIYGVMASMLGTIVPALGATLSLGTLQLSWLALAQGLGLASTSVRAGALMDRQGKKPGIVGGLVASVAGLVLLAHPSGLELAMVAMALLGVGGSLVIVGANALVNDISEGNKASALNVLNLFVGLGGMATPLVAGNLLHGDATRVAWAGAGMAVVALVVSVVAPMPGPAPVSQEKGARGVLRMPLLYGLSCVTFLYTACEFAMWNWLPKYLIGTGMPSVRALNILSLGFASGMLVGRFIAATLLGRVSPVLLVLCCALAMAVASGATLALGGGPGTGVLVFVTGLAMAPVFPTSIAIIGHLFPRGSGTAIGFAITCGFSGLVVSSPVIGAIAGDTPQGIGRALILIPLLSGAIALLLLTLRGRLSASQ